MSLLSLLPSPSDSPASNIIPIIDDGNNRTAAVAFVAGIVLVFVVMILSRKR